MADSDLETLLARAEGLEREYDWAKAAETLREALESIPGEDTSKTGQVAERQAYALHKAAFQADTSDEFRNLVGNAIQQYETTKEIYGPTTDADSEARIARCDAMIAFLNYWLAPNATEKKKLIDEAWRLAKEAMNKFDRVPAALEFGRTYDDLSTAAALSLYYAPDFQTRKVIVGQALDLGERTLAHLSGLADVRQLARLYVKNSAWLTLYTYFLEPADGESHYLRALDLWLKAREMSDEDAMIGTVFYQILMGMPMPVGYKETREINEDSLEFCVKTRDRFVIGLASEAIASMVSWEMEGMEDPSEIRALLPKVRQSSENSAREFSICSFVGFDISAWACSAAPLSAYYYFLSKIETDIDKKLKLARNAAGEYQKAIQIFKQSEYLESLGYAYGMLNEALIVLARFETSPQNRKSLLQQARSCQLEESTIVGGFYPYSYWLRAQREETLAKIECLLADLEETPGDRLDRLRAAVSNRERSLDLASKTPQRDMDTPRLMWIGKTWSDLGSLRERLHRLSSDRNDLTKASAAFENAVQTLREIGAYGLVAETYWKAAQVFDLLGNHLAASERFLRAADNYRMAAEKTSRLRNLYEEHALYMRAWSEIERARHYHAEQEASISRECYEKAAELLKSTQRWSYLSDNYSAWAQVENAENLSRKEEAKESVEEFESAARQFEDTKISLQGVLKKIDDADERQQVSDLLIAVDHRRDYCRARILLEESRIFDERGDYHASSSRYGQAAEEFERILKKLESPSDQKEIKLVAALSRAWETMARAEADVSPQLYEDASNLFEKAKDLSQGKRSTLLALGHSRFCKALAAGTSFADTGNLEMHSIAIKNLESAAVHYLKAGQTGASEYAKASKLLLDGYVYMKKASVEGDQAKKSRYYAMAEKVLQAAASSFDGAGQPRKKEQVVRLLGRVRDERELAVSLTKVLEAPDIVSATMAFSSPSPTQEKAVGLERFEHAEIQAIVIAQPRGILVGEALTLEIELVNAGRGPARLTKVEEVVPRGFSVVSVPEEYRMEDFCLNLKGKRLESLKTADVRLVLKPDAHGRFLFRPRVMYLDDSGRYKSHEPEPVEIEVKEMGISGWLKGPDSRR